MKTILKLEEVAQLALGIALFAYLDLSWWWFFGLFLAPDIGMLGYLVNTKVGALTYNILHNKTITIALLFFGYFYESSQVLMIGIILFSHAAFDRMLGYGLKFEDSFYNTHLRRIGNK